MFYKIHIAIVFLAAFFFNSCRNGESSDQEKIKRLENEIEKLKSDNESDNKQYIENENNSKTINNNHNKSVSYYVYAKFKIRYTAMSGVNQTKEYENVGITNIINLDSFTEEVKYKLKDFIKRQNILLTAPFNSNQKIVNIEIFSSYDYVSASKEREKIDYKYEIDLKDQF